MKTKQLIEELELKLSEKKDFDFDSFIIQLAIDKLKADGSELDEEELGWFTLGDD